MEHDTIAEQRLNSALERLTTIQKSVLELNQEAARIRRHVQDFDVNIDALNLLVTACSRDKKGRGAGILEPMITYARQAGLYVDPREVRETTTSPRGPRPETVEELSEDAHAHPAVDHLKLASQLAVAFAVTLGLFLIIH